MAFDASVHAKAIELTKSSIAMTTAAGSGHPTSAASLAHVVTLLMYHHMRFDPGDPAHPAADRLVLLEMAFISRFPLKIVASHTGVSLAADGPSQMALPDVAFFRAWSTVHNRQGEPFFYLLQPADAYAAYALTLAMAAHEGPCYLRTMRPDVPFLYDETTTFRLGGHQVLAEGRDLLIVASGYMVHEARGALATLQQQGIAATLMDLYSLPFDREALATLAQDNQGRVLTLEDNYGGGFGSAVAEALSEHGGGCTVQQMYVRQIPKSGRTPADVLRYLGLSADDIVNTALELVAVASS